jgi:hypothetical protein
MGSNPGRVSFVLFFELFHSLHVVVLHCTNSHCTRAVHFSKIVTVHHCMTLHLVALVSFVPHRSVRPPRWHYRL